MRKTKERKKEKRFPSKIFKRNVENATRTYTSGNRVKRTRFLRQQYKIS